MSGVRFRDLRETDSSCRYATVYLIDRHTQLSEEDPGVLKSDQDHDIEPDTDGKFSPLAAGRTNTSSRLDPWVGTGSSVPELRDYSIPRRESGGDRFPTVTDAVQGGAVSSLRVFSRSLPVSRVASMAIMKWGCRNSAFLAPGQSTSCANEVPFTSNSLSVCSSL